MEIDIVVPSGRATPIISDLTRRRGEIRCATIRGENKVKLSLFFLAFVFSFWSYTEDIRKIFMNNANCACVCMCMCINYRS